MWFWSSRGGANIHTLLTEQCQKEGVAGTVGVATVKQEVVPQRGDGERELGMVQDGRENGAQSLK